MNTWLKQRSEHITPSGTKLSAWTVSVEASALNKLYGISKDDPERFIPPQRRRADIKRSRIEVKSDKHFSVTNNDELIRFACGTGCRRNVLEKLEGRDLWQRPLMVAEMDKLATKGTLTDKEKANLNAIRDALRTFPDQEYFVCHRGDKGGRIRYAPIIGPDSDRIINRFLKTNDTEKVWKHVPARMDVHSCRAMYARDLYNMYARDIEDIPYDKYLKGIDKWEQSEVYHCRGDELGKKLDRLAMAKCTKALGHNRVSVIASSYLYGL